MLCCLIDAISKWSPFSWCLHEVRSFYVLFWVSCGINREVSILVRTRCLTIGIWFVCWDAKTYFTSIVHSLWICCLRSSIYFGRLTLTICCVWCLFSLLVSKPYIRCIVVLWTAYCKDSNESRFLTDFDTRNHCNLLLLLMLFYILFMPWCP